MMAASDEEESSALSDEYRLNYTAKVDQVINEYDAEINECVANANQPERFRGPSGAAGLTTSGVYSVIPPAPLLTNGIKAGDVKGVKARDVMAETPTSPSSESPTGGARGKDVTRNREYMFKVLVVGEFGVGKTSIIRRFTEGTFSPGYKVTIGVDFALKSIEWNPQTVVKLQLWDIAGHERFGHMTRVYYKYAVAALIVFDLTRPGTLDAVQKWLHDVRSKAFVADEEPIPCFLLANKCDVENVRMNTQHLNEFCKTNDIPAWFPTSAKTGDNIKDAMRHVVDHLLRSTGADDNLSVEESVRAIHVTDSQRGESLHAGRSKCCS